jgi:hypothetical protein
MKVILHDRQHTIAEAHGDSLRRALNELADKPGLQRYKPEAMPFDRLVIEFEEDFYETGVEEP